MFLMLIFELTKIVLLRQTTNTKLGFKKEHIHCRYYMSMTLEKCRDSDQLNFVHLVHYSFIYLHYENKNVITVV